MLAEDRFDLRGITPLEDVPDRGVSRRAAPLQAEGRVQLAAMNIDEGDDASIRVATCYGGEDGEQQHVGSLYFWPCPRRGSGTSASRSAGAACNARSSSPVAAR